jgi:hypothetical protein
MHRKEVMKGMRLKKRILKVKALRNQANRRGHKLSEAPAPRSFHFDTPPHQFTIGGIPAQIRFLSRGFKRFANEQK